jgi:hypothetical protein
VIGYIAHLGGIISTCRCISARELLQNFSIDLINRKELKLGEEVIARLKELSGAC